MADQQVSGLVGRLRADADDLANAADAGLDLDPETLGRIQAGLSEVERQLAAAPNGTAQIAVDPQAANLEAEDHVLAALLSSNTTAGNPAVRSVRPMLGETGDAFAGEANRLIYQAIIAADANGGADKITVTDHLDKAGALAKAGGKKRIAELAKLGGDTATLPEYARIVRRLALERGLARVTSATPRNPEAIAEAAAALTREQIAGDPRRAVDGSDWLSSQPDGCPAVWGKGDAVLWAQGEPLMLYGPDGVGKTSVAQQVVLHLCGVRREPLLGLPVTRAERPVLYLACDRPRQARRSLYRMVPRENHGELKGRLFIWEGPLPFSIPTQPRALLDFCQLHDCGTLIVDSLKDVAVDLTKPETALRVNQAFQWLNANSVELLILHHPRKDPAGTVQKPKELEDVYGDRNFVAGMGSVMLLWGKAGDPIVEMRHLKQPAGEVGPFKLIHDHQGGISDLYEYRTIIEILKASHTPVTAAEVAREFFGAGEPGKNEVEKTRRELRKLVEQGMAAEFRDAATQALAFAAT